MRINLSPAVAVGAAIALLLGACRSEPVPVAVGEDALDSAEPVENATLAIPAASTADPEDEEPFPPGVASPTSAPDPAAADEITDDDEDFIQEIGVGERVEVGFVTDDGVTLTGTLFGQGTTVVVLAHMRPTDQTSWMPFAEKLAAAGYAAFTFDFRGYGDSSGEQDYGVMDRDMLAVVRYLQNEQLAENIIVVGASMGGTYATAVLPEEAVIAGIFISSPTSIDGFTVNQSTLQRAGQPTLFIAAQDDRPYVDEITRMYEASAEPKKLVILDGAVHGTFIFDTPQGPVLEETLLEFIDNNAE